MPSEADITRNDQPLLFGHPRALAVLAGTEFWERLSFKGMQSLLVLYMVQQLLLPGHVERIVGFSVFRHVVEAFNGHLPTVALASTIFSLYIALVTFTPLLGGVVGDRLLGRTGAVVTGAVLMALGHLCMAFDASFLLALLLLILGAGLLRANLSPQVGALYSPEDRRRETGFQIYAAAVNAGGFVAPLITGSMSQAWGWHAGFSFAAAGMLLGLAVYILGRRQLPAQPARAQRREAKRPLTRPEWRRVYLLIALMPLIGAFWVSQSQVWSLYNLWVRDHLELAVGGFHMPVPWLSSLDSLVPFMALPPLLWLWAWQARRGREPDEFGKLAIGCFIFAAATLWLGLGQFVLDAHGRTPLLWAVAFHVVSNVGWLYVSPTSAALYNRAAPAPIVGTVMAMTLLAVSMGSLVSGRIGGLYEQLTPLQFWGLHAVITAVGGAAIVVFGMLFRRALFGTADANIADASPQPAE
jgi:POT family proton-dependent oligopeptide transporter